MAEHTFSEIKSIPQRVKNVMVFNIKVVDKDGHIVGILPQEIELELSPPIPNVKVILKIMDYLEVKDE